MKEERKKNVLESNEKEKDCIILYTSDMHVILIFKKNISHSAKETESYLIRYQVDD